MNGFAKILVAVLSFISLGSCLSFRVKAPLPSENRLELIELCKEVKEQGESLVPSDFCVEFTNKDRQVCCFIKVQSEAEETPLCWKWYSPDRALWKETRTMAVKKGKVGLSVITAYDFIRPNDQKIKKGEWTVAVFVNEVLAGRTKFKIGN